MCIALLRVFAGRFGLVGAFCCFVFWGVGCLLIFLADLFLGRADCCLFDCIGVGLVVEVGVVVGLVTVASFMMGGLVMVDVLLEWVVCACVFLLVW